jgi:hypothetical protein
LPVVLFTAVTVAMLPSGLYVVCVVTLMSSEGGQPVPLLEELDELELDELDPVRQLRTRLVSRPAASYSKQVGIAMGSVLVCTLPALLKAVVLTRRVSLRVGMVEGRDRALPPLVP